MADEQQPPDERDRTDETRETPPAGADETREMPPAGSGDQTEAMPRAGDTAVSPSVSRWSGRAGVPPPDAVVVREAVPAEEGMADDRRWWLPVVLALMALALLAVLGVGLWLALRGTDNSAPVTPPASPTPVEPSPSTPTTPSPALTSAPGPTVPAQVVVPRLGGIDSATAQSILDRLGLTSRLTSRPDPVARPGTVLETDPAEGTAVPAGTQVTLVIAAPASPAPPSPDVPSPAPPSTVLPSPLRSR